MILTRFCSQEEYDKFMAGETQTNTTDHYKGGRGGSTSVGFCFFPYPPRRAWRYLKGIVDFDVCMVLDIDEELLTESYGKYVNYTRPTENGFHSCIKIEYCMTAYSNKVVRLVKVLKPEEFATQEEMFSTMLVKKILQS